MTSARRYYLGTPVLLGVHNIPRKEGKQICAANSNGLTTLKLLFLRLVLEGDLPRQCAADSSEREGVAIS